MIPTWNINSCVVPQTGVLLPTRSRGYKHAFWVDTILSVLPLLALISSQQTSAVMIMTIVPQMGKLRHGDVRELAPGHAGYRWMGHDLNGLHFSCSGEENADKLLMVFKYSFDVKNNNNKHGQ